ncbi:MAG: anhydro-N-acetylmuramic acid kinase [Salinisphaeraceae bacterium]
MTGYYIGVISGTSLDAADVVLARAADGDRPTLEATHSHPPPDALRQRLLQITQTRPPIDIRELGQLDRQVADWMADGVLALLDKAAMAPGRVRAIGSHGQTLYHDPQPPHPFTLQIGDPNRLAARTGITTVADFRRADMAAGGQGAPMVCGFHQAMLALPDRQRAVINIGGIANLTCLPAGATLEDPRLTGFDTGPGNALMDAWIARHQGRLQDTNGEWASAGRVHEGLLSILMADPYIRTAPPKSTGREYFHLGWLDQQLAGMPAIAPADVQRTLLEFTAVSIRDAVTACAGRTDEVLLCGGGARNARLRERLSAMLAPTQVITTDDAGIPADWVEAAAFAWLAMRTLAGLPGNVPSVTGASRAVILGGIYAPAVVSRRPSPG